MSNETVNTETKPKTREPVPESKTIRVTLPRSLSREQIKAHFGDCEKIVSQRYIYYTGLTYIEFEDIPAAKAAIEKHNEKIWKVIPERSRNRTELEWRVSCRFAPPQKPRTPRVSDVEVVVLHLPLNVTEDDVRRIFEGFEVKNVEIPKVHPSKKNRHVFVTFPSNEVQLRAIKETEGTTVEDVTIKVEARAIRSPRRPIRGRGRFGKRNNVRSRRMGRKGGRPVRPRSKTGAKRDSAPVEPNESVFIQVPRYATHEQVKENLLKNVKDFKLFLRSRRPRGLPPLCFVTFPSVDEAKKYIEEVNETKWNATIQFRDKSRELEWTVRASFARPRAPRGSKAQAGQN